VRLCNPLFSPAICCGDVIIRRDCVALGRRVRRTDDIGDSYRYPRRGTLMTVTNVGPDALSGRRLRRLAKRPGEKTGLTVAAITRLSRHPPD
jgi:hypothetical protein